MKDCCKEVKTPYCPTCGSKIVEPTVYDNDVQKIAVMLHKMFCTDNHNDGCGWFYEVSNNIHDWKGFEHSSWYEKAKEVLDIMAVNEFLEWEQEFQFIKKIV